MEAGLTGWRLDGGWMDWMEAGWRRGGVLVVVWRSVRGPGRRVDFGSPRPKTPVPQESCYGVVQSRLSSQRLIDTILGSGVSGRLWAFLPQCLCLPALMHGRARMKKRFGVLLVWTR